MASEASGDEATGIFEPISPPFRDIDGTHQGPLIMVTSIPLIAVAALTVVVKIWTVYGITRKLGLSEVTMIAAILFGIGYLVAINESAMSGLGSTADELNDASIKKLSKSYYASNILLILAQACAKASVVLLFIKVIGWRSIWKVDRYASQAVLGYTCLWGIAGVFAVAFQCSPTRYAIGPDDNNTCTDQFAIQAGLRATDVLSDITIALLPILLMTKLQTSRKSRLLVIVLFGARLCVVVPCIISIVTLSDFYNASTEDRPFRAVTPSIWTSVWLSLSIITACIPSIKQFLADWAAGLSRAAIGEDLDAEHFTVRSRSGNNSKMESSNRNGQLATKLGLNRSGRAAVMSTSRSGGTRDDEGTPMPTQKGQHSRSDDTSESVRGLTDGVIMQTTDYAIEYEDLEMVPLDRDGSTSSGTEKGQNSALRTRA